MLTPAARQELATQLFKILNENEMGTRELIRALTERADIDEMDAREVLWRLLGSDELEFTSDKRVIRRQERKVA